MSLTSYVHECRSYRNNQIALHRVTANRSYNVQQRSTTFQLYLKQYILNIRISNSLKSWKK